MRFSTKTLQNTFEEKKKAEGEGERQRVKQERKEIEGKLAEKEAEVARLRRDIVGKQVVIDIKKLRLNMIRPNMETN